MDNAVVTTHKLDFEVSDSPYVKCFPDWAKLDHKLFRVGTCDGQWTSTEDSFVIISIANRKPGNGHLNDVFEWFEWSCRTAGKNLLVVELLNDSFYRHLIKKRGFVPLDKEKMNCIKIFNKKKYRHLLKKGNEIIIPGILKCR